MSAPYEKQVRTALAKVSGRGSHEPVATALVDLGLDSLGALQVGIELEAELGLPQGAMPLIGLAHTIDWLIKASAAATAAMLPPGEYAIVELMGHTTMIGRVSEVDRFGTKLLQIEPIFNGQLLGPVLHGGSSIYRFTPCTVSVATERAPKEAWQLPGAVRATIPPAMLPPPTEEEPF